MKKFSKEWFENKLKQYKSMQKGSPMRLTATKGYKPITTTKSKQEQRIESLVKLAKEKHIKLEVD